jgi:hypothetical protein
LKLIRSSTTRTVNRPGSAFQNKVSRSARNQLC